MAGKQKGLKSQPSPAPTQDKTSADQDQRKRQDDEAKKLQSQHGDEEQTDNQE